MPSESAKQHRFMAADYARAKAGKPTRSGMGLAKLREWMHADKKKAFTEAMRMKGGKNGG